MTHTYSVDYNKSPRKKYPSPSKISSPSLPPLMRTQNTTNTKRILFVSFHSISSTHSLVHFGRELLPGSFPRNGGCNAAEIPLEALFFFFFFFFFRDGCWWGEGEKGERRERNALRVLVHIHGRGRIYKDQFVHSSRHRNIEISKAYRRFSLSLSLPRGFRLPDLFTFQLIKPKPQPKHAISLQQFPHNPITPPKMNEDQSTICHFF